MFKYQDFEPQPFGLWFKLKGYLPETPWLGMFGKNTKHNGGL